MNECRNAMNFFNSLIDQLRAGDPFLIGIGVFVLRLSILVLRRPKNQTAPLREAFT
jgi:hypothetical protein